MSSKKELQEYVQDLFAEGERAIPKKGLDEACYTASELCLFGELDLFPREALLVWALVERVRRDGGFPKNLRA